MENKGYQERLHDLNIYSQQRRCEMYMITLLWKISEKYVQGYDVTFFTNPRRGRLAVLHFFSAVLFKATVDKFKAGLIRPLFQDVPW